MTKLSALLRAAAELAADRTSGATELTVAAVELLRAALGARLDISQLALALTEAQPSMASILNAVRVARFGSRADLERFAARLARAPQALARYSEAVVGSRVVTCSNSGSVVAVLTSLSKRRRLEVACAEGRPALEGRRLCATLAAAGIRVTCYGDAALAQGLIGADTVLVGADAVTPDWFLNKTGTMMLAAAAVHHGVPVYVVASRDKLISRTVAEQIRVREEPFAEVWDTPPVGVQVRNCYFERVPLELVTGVITDSGVLAGTMVGEACDASTDESGQERLP